MRSSPPVIQRHRNEACQGSSEACHSDQRARLCLTFLSVSRRQGLICLRRFSLSAVKAPDCGNTSRDPTTTQIVVDRERILACQEHEDECAGYGSEGPSRGHVLIMSQGHRLTLMSQVFIFARVIAFCCFQNP